MAEAKRRGIDLQANDGFSVKERELPFSNLPWREWLVRYYSHIASAPMASRHERLWEWFDVLAPGVKPRPRVEVWPRGGAKSSSGELGCARVAAKLSRRFVLYICETQPQADKHVQSIATLLEPLVKRAINRYGASKGWSHDQLRTANGFNVAGIGLDVASRGVKIDNFRPDLIILDDIDSLHDTTKTIDKKIDTITHALLPTGSPDCAVLFLQNLIHEDSIVAQLADDRAQYLLDREVTTVEPAIVGMETQRIDRGDGRNIWHITAGEATWAGQSIETCEKQINEWGLTAFMQEAQQEVAGAQGYMFNPNRIKTVPLGDAPRYPTDYPIATLRGQLAIEAACQAWDLAATENGGDWTVGFSLAKFTNGAFGIFPTIRGQWAPERVKAAIGIGSAWFKTIFPQMRLKMPQDPGQAGKDQAQQMRRTFHESAPQINTITGSKATRATPFSEAVNLGNVFFVEMPLPEALRDTRTESTNFRPLTEDLSFSAWSKCVTMELRAFRPEITNQHDDIIDAGSDAFNDLHHKRELAYS